MRVPAALGRAARVQCSAGLSPKAPAVGTVQRRVQICCFGVSAVHTELSAWANRLQQVLHVLFCCVRKGFCAAHTHSKYFTALNLAIQAFMLLAYCCPRFSGGAGASGSVAVCPSEVSSERQPCLCLANFAMQKLCRAWVVGWCGACLPADLCAGRRRCCLSRGGAKLHRRSTCGSR